ncbi:hypothetical protein EV561_104110 [Rhizobium sp. BK376]|nr:hypothetical protein EV561_104110 [Rhizobium sp. BK376]
MKPNKIFEFETYTNIRRIVPGYYVDIVTVPSNLPLNHPARRVYDDRSIEVPKTNGSIWLTIKSHFGKGHIGIAVFAAGEDSVICECIDITVNNPHIRKSISWWLYLFAEDYFNFPVVSDADLYNEPKLFYSEQFRKFANKQL